MNPKFFDVKKEKQDAIINACLKVFAENGYKKASTDVIVKTARSEEHTSELQSQC